MVENGVTYLDDVLGDRLTALKSDRERAKATLERIKVQSAPQIALEPDQIERFGTFMRERITEGEISFRKAYLRSIVDAIEVDDKVIRIYGSKASLEQAVIAGEQIGKGVRSFVRKWRANDFKWLAYKTEPRVPDLAALSGGFARNVVAPYRIAASFPARRG
jgi:site-specific DNA recombinase